MDQSVISAMMDALGDFLPKNTSIAISDNRQFIYYQPSKIIDLKIKPGDQIKEGSATHKALIERHKISEKINSEVFGVSYYGVSFPILEGDQPAGAITAVLPTNFPQLASTFITIRTSDRWIPVRFDEVIYLESQTRRTKVETERGEGFHKYNLSQLEFMLPDHFIRVHRSYIVNINYIHEIHPDSHSTFMLILKNKTKIPVSQSYASYFRRSLNF